jgi:hypothetical protein
VVGLRPLACWDCGFGSRQGQGCTSVVLSGRRLCDEMNLLVCVIGRDQVQQKPYTTTMSIRGKKKKKEISYVLQWLQGK